MADNNNPIKYSDLISPDNSITDLIKQLDELSDQNSYDFFDKNIGKEVVKEFLLNPNAMYLEAEEIYKKYQK